MEHASGRIGTGGSEGPVRTFEERIAENRLPIRAPLALFVGAPIVAGLASGFRAERSPQKRVVHATFLGSAMAYLTTSLLDFALHFRMERERSGRWLAFRVIPAGETANHLLTIATLVSILVLSRAPRRRPAARDWWSLAAPGAFLALGWRDEIVYHRRRSDHREDMLHTTAHLAAGVMLTSFTALRTACWR